MCIISFNPYNNPYKEGNIIPEGLSLPVTFVPLLSICWGWGLGGYCAGLGAKTLACHSPASQGPRAQQKVVLVRGKVT